MATARKEPDGVSVTIPADIAERFHLAEGVEVEVDPTEEGIFLRPVGVGPWFSIEWERALDAVMGMYGDSLRKMDEPEPEPQAGEAGEATDSHGNTPEGQA